MRRPGPGRASVARLGPRGRGGASWSSHKGLAQGGMAMRTVMMMALCCVCAVARTSGSHVLFMFADDRAWLAA